MSSTATNTPVDVRVSRPWGPAALAVGAALAFSVVSAAGTLALDAIAPGIDGRARDLAVALAADGWQ